MKSSFVSLIGRPSSGKSTLLNRLCGNKVSIVSAVPQTTRNKIRGIVNRERGQLVFIDTPGFHKSEVKFNRHLHNLIISALKEVEMALYLIDLTRPIGEEERAIMKLLQSFKGPLIIALNKADIKDKHLNHIKTELEKLNLHIPPLIISALNGSGVEELINRLFDFAPEGEILYPTDIYTDQDPEFRISEVIREKAINKTFQELPHSIYVEIADMEKTENKLWIRGFIFVERESQKGILVGKNGDKIKQIVKEAKHDLSKLFPYKIQLDIRVRVKAKWRKKDMIVKKLLGR